MDDIRTAAWRGALPEIRCKCCNRLLFKGRAELVEIKCPKCNTCQTVAGTDSGALGKTKGVWGGKQSIE